MRWRRSKGLEAAPVRFLWERVQPLLQSGFVRSVSAMMAYTLVGHGIYVLTAPLLGRLYGPEEMGIYGLFFTIVATVAGFVCLLYDFAIPAAVSDRDARRLTVGGGCLALVLCPLFAIILGLFAYHGMFGLGVLPVWAMALMVPILLVQAAIQLIQGWLIRTSQTVMVGKASVSLNLGRGATQVGGGWVLPSWWILAAGELIGRVLSLWQMLRRFGMPNFRDLPTAEDTRATLRRYREFPTVLLPAMTLDSVVVVVQVTGLSILYGSVGLGQYYLMRRTLDLPIAFMFKSLSDVFYGKLAEYARTTPERVRPFFTRAFLFLLSVGSVGALPVMFWGAELFQIVYGSEWRTAGLLAGAMMPATVLNLAVAPVARVFALTSKPHLRLIAGAVSAVGTAIVLALAHHRDWDLLTATAGLSATIVVSYFAYFLAGYLASANIRVMQ